MQAEVPGRDGDFDLPGRKVQRGAIGDRKIDMPVSAAAAAAMVSGKMRIVTVRSRMRASGGRL